VLVRKGIKNMSNLEEEAISWVKVREVVYLRKRVFQALRTAIEAGSTYEWGEYDPEVWAEELQLYSSDLEGVSVGVLALLIEEYQKEIEQ
jgi:hypothetical protein